MTRFGNLRIPPSLNNLKTPKSGVQIRVIRVLFIKNLFLGVWSVLSAQVSPASSWPPPTVISPLSCLFPTLLYTKTSLVQVQTNVRVNAANGAEIDRGVDHVTRKSRQKTQNSTHQNGPIEVARRNQVERSVHEHDRHFVCGDLERRRGKFSLARPRVGMRLFWRTNSSCLSGITQSERERKLPYSSPLPGRVVCFELAPDDASQMPERVNLLAHRHALEEAVEADHQVLNGNAKIEREMMKFELL